MYDNTCEVIKKMLRIIGIAEIWENGPLSVRNIFVLK